MTVLWGLRAALPDPPPVTPLEEGAGCVMHTAIVRLEGFNVQQIGKHPSPDTMRLIEDLRRIEMLLSVSSKAVEFGSSDAQSLRWDGDNPILPLRFDKWLASQNQSVQMVWKKIMPFIDSQMPTKYSFEVARQGRVKNAAISDGPALKH